MEHLHRLSASSLDGLTRSLRSGALAQGLSQSTLNQLVGPALSDKIRSELESLAAKGFTPAQMAVLLEELGVARDRALQLDHVVDLVLTGPEAPGVPVRDTSAVFHELIEKAEREVFIVGFAFYQGKILFRRLAEKLDADPAFQVHICLEIQRKMGDTTIASDLVNRFRQDFFSRNWPGERHPELWYDPRSLVIDAKSKSSLHAKCVIVDQQDALITSANFTEAAQRRNIEAGVLLRHSPSARRLLLHFRQLMERGELQKV